MVTKVQFVNEWAVCSDKIARHGDCIDHCIYHNSLYPDFGQSPLKGLAGGDHAYIEYRIDASGYCRATRVERAFHIKTRAEFTNEWGVCSGDIQERAGCPGGKEHGTSRACIYHNRTSTETRLLDSVGKEVEIVYRKLPWLCAAVQESVAGESH